MKKTHSLILSAAIASLLAGPALAGPSAKFAATWTTKPALESVIAITDEDEDTGVLVDSRDGYTMATIKIPQAKELLVGVSAEIGLVTDTSVKGKNGGSAKAMAGANAYVNLFAVPTTTYDGTTDPAGGVPAAPGQIMLSERVQELSATLGGVIQSCTDGDTNFDGVAEEEPDGTINIAAECVVTDEQIGLLQDTTAAHHFNFVFPNLPQGEYDIVAVFTTGARAEVNICDSDTDYCGDLYDPEGTASASADAMAVINKTMLTVQQVRAVNGDIDPGAVIEITD
jgi:hypothetical protein